MKSVSTDSSSHKTKPRVREDGMELLKKVANQAANTTGFVFHGSHQVHANLERQPV